MNLTVSASPHIHSGASTQKVMRDVLIALAPALIASIVIFGFRSLLVTAVCVAACILFEWGFEKICRKKVTISDLSAAVTGTLLAFNLPPSIPLWQAIFGCLIAIVAVKGLFGGLGRNFANPAATARVVLVLSFSSTMTTWIYPDGISTATPMVMLAKGTLPDFGQLITGFTGGCIGETCSIALLIGFAYLLIRRVITWHTPVCYIATVFVMMLAFGQNPLYQVLSGGLLLGAIFMATDYVTTPSTSWGKVIFGVGAGAITVLVRLYGNFNEGVSFAILLMNILTPYISKWTAKKPFGGAGK